MFEAGGPDKLINMLLSGSKPVEMRAKMMVSLFQARPEHPEAMLGVATAMLNQVAAAAPAAEVAELKAKYTQALAELENGPARPATFIAPADGEMPGPKPRGDVVTPDGQERFPFMHPDVNLDDHQHRRHGVPRRQGGRGARAERLDPPGRARRPCSSAGCPAPTAWRSASATNPSCCTPPGKCSRRKKPAS